MKKLITLITLLVLTSIFFTSCKTYKTVYSEPLYEEVKVRDLIYTPATHGSGTDMTMDYTTGQPGLAMVNVETKEVFAIVFECQHGSFIIEDNENLWKKLREDSIYTCVYQEKYRYIYENKELIGRALVSYNFLGLKEFPELMEKVNITNSKERFLK